MTDDEGDLLGKVLRLLSVTVLLVVSTLVLSGLFLTGRGQDEMKQSDQAFHEGDLRASIRFARKAALSYVPGSSHVGAAHARLEAIARGAEAEGNFEIARLAWDSLRLVHVQTDYPGRPKSGAQAKAEERLKELMTPLPSEK